MMLTRHARKTSTKSQLRGLRPDYAVPLGWVLTREAKVVHEGCRGRWGPSTGRAGARSRV
jgi:hypothetical protein